ncbi:hypothetical protein B0T25DRAFT_452576 [Lasiosphaeria hispida]|uniref:Zn(2)-C6 fungal-type domain-containing protein n=1 Tax=Lasiosphaeria hispida TaxID=260671 RepID=A0AAJ0HL20_9PEZI|nr:hypothetical protein B0T25DRAFT_452576 [Lasiosphaeria hispida]
MGNGPAFKVFSLSGGDKQARDYKTRKPHKKTRSGCQTCRTKRVKLLIIIGKKLYGTRTNKKKCDESQPRCARCRRNSRQCVYNQSNDYSTSDQTTSLTFTPTILSAVTVTSFPPPISRLLHHSQTQWSAIFHMPCSDQIITLFHANPLVHTAILALTASHLRHLSPHALEYRIAEHLQLAAALREYQTVLDTPFGELGRDGVDALVLSAILLNMLAFTLPAANSHAGGGGGEADPRASWVFSAREDRLGWLALQAGLRPLLSSIGGCFEEVTGFLSVVFLGKGARSLSFVEACARGGGPVEMPESWKRFFGMESLMDLTECTDDSLKRAGDVFNPLVTAVLQLRCLEPLPSNAFRCFQFVGKMQPDFLSRLYDRDGKALWLLGYWLGIMSRFRSIWWCQGRVARDYAAIRMWLNRPHPPGRQPSEAKQWEEMMVEFDKVYVGCLIGNGIIG